MFQGEAGGETKKTERYAIYVDFLLQFSSLALPFILKGKLTARTVLRRITVGQTSIRRVCEEIGSLEKIII